MDKSVVLPLSLLTEGEKGIIKKLNGGRRFQEKMLSMGLIQGSSVEILAGTPGRPLVLKAGAVRIALGYGLAQKIEIEQQ